MIAVDMAEGKLYHDAALKDKLAAAQPFGDWIEKVVDLNALLRDVPEAALFTGRRPAQAPDRGGLYAGGTGAGSGADGRGRQGNDRLDGRRHARRGAVVGQYRPLSHFFRQNFSQVTNPPIDSLREGRVMSLKTRFGNLQERAGRKLQPDRDSGAGKPVHRQCRIRRDGEAVRRACGHHRLHLRGRAIDALRQGLERIRAEAEDAVRSGAGHLVLTDQHQRRTRWRCR